MCACVNLHSIHRISIPCKNDLDFCDIFAYSPSTFGTRACTRRAVNFTVLVRMCLRVRVHWFFKIPAPKSTISQVPCSVRIPLVEREGDDTEDALDSLDSSMRHTYHSSSSLTSKTTLRPSSIREQRFL